MGGVVARALESRRSEPEEDREVPLLWSHVLRYSLGQPSPPRNSQLTTALFV